MKQPYAHVLDDYFDALLEEGLSLAPEPKPELEPELELKHEPELKHELHEPQPELAPALELAPQKAQPALGPVLPYAEPDAAARRQALEALLAQVAALKEEETTLSEPQAAPQIAAEPEPVVVPAPVEVPTLVLPVVEPIVEPIAEQIVEPIVEPIVEQIAEQIVEPIVEPIVEVSVEIAIDLELQAQLAGQQRLADQAVAWRNMDTEHSFQVLFFEVAGMTFAVPLTHLGGIYQVAKLTSLFGKPHWFAGVQTERDRQIYAVDTARWAMPGHTAQEEYGYLVTLGESNWGLGCHQLKGTALLTRDQVKWRATPGARPWLAGMVKERMCALLHVDALIALLEQGKNIDGQQV